MNTNKQIEKPIVGQLLFLLDRSNKHQGLIEVKVSKVGTKFFELTRIGEHPYPIRSKFRISDWGEESSFTASIKLYSSREDRALEIERDGILAVLREIFSWSGSGQKMTLETLRQIHKLSEEAMIAARKGGV